MSTEKETLMDEVSNGITELEVADELHVCPGCEYQRGFHVSFIKRQERPDALRLVLICPGCGGRFDIARSI